MIIEFVSAPAQNGERLDNALRPFAAEISRGRLQKAIRSGHCLIDGMPAADPARKLRAGQKIAINIPEDTAAISPAREPVQIVWRDAHIAVISKPCGLATHPCPSCQEETLAHRLLATFPELAAMGGQRPGIVHRLDRDTSGLMLVALNDAARIRLADAFAQRQIHKEYLALAYGNPEKSGICDAAIGRHPSMRTRMAQVEEKNGGKSARSRWRRLWQNGRVALLAVEIASGRTHQIRVHLSGINLPILGDSTYAPAKVAALAPRQMLHAWRLEFRHPVTDEPLAFCVSPPEDFFDAALVQDNEMRRIVVTGNQGCGKSSFCEYLRALGMPGVSADAIVAQMYAGKSEATLWMEEHLGADILAPAGAVDKKRLLRLMERRPDLRRELEKVVHGLVFAEIENFWAMAEKSGSAAAFAEIPLYFESGFADRIRPRPYCVGISCPQETRWRRIAQNRGWSREKISELEAWQWPEAKKMAACDLVIANNGQPADLQKAAAALARRLEAERQKAAEDKEKTLRSICGCGSI